MAKSDYLPTIGLEIHAELNTKTKMFCSSKNDAAEKRPNINVCPVCLAHPGTLPVINKEAVRHVLRVGAALGSTLADYTEFDRKNYFYPDLPKGYQLSQYEYPLVSGGMLNGVQLTRIHLEEDTASSVHDENSDATLVDYNRAGVPLMELVTEPVLHSAQDAGNFGRELQLLLRTLGASEADMEKGQMRLEANVSVARVDQNLGSSAGADNVAANESEDTMKSASTASKKQTDAGEPAGISFTSSSMASTAQQRQQPVSLSSLGTKVEIKNINSFRAMERAIEFEVKRQIALLERGERVVQETRGWDENKQATFSQRIKEGSADYRYFPDPDLPSLKLSEIGLTEDAVKKTLPELPWRKRARLAALGINTQDVELYVKDPVFGGFFVEVSQGLSNAPELMKVASNYIANDLVNLVRDIEERDTKELDILPISANNFSKIIQLISQKKISSKAAKELLSACLENGGDPEAWANKNGLIQTSDASVVEAVVSKVVADNMSVAEDYKNGKAAALEYLVGQGMKALRGAADPVTLREMIKKQLS